MPWQTHFELTSVGLWLIHLCMIDKGIVVVVSMSTLPICCLIPFSYSFCGCAQLNPTTFAGSLFRNPPRLCFWCLLLPPVARLGCEFQFGALGHQHLMKNRVRQPLCRWFKLLTNHGQLQIRTFAAVFRFQKLDFGCLFVRLGTPFGVPTQIHNLGPPARCPLTPLLVGRVPLRKSTTGKKGTLILTSLLEDLAGCGSLRLPVSGSFGSQAARLAVAQNLPVKLFAAWLSGARAQVETLQGDALPVDPFTCKAGSQGTPPFKTKKIIRYSYWA